MEVIFTDELRAMLAKKGFDPAMGARPMLRLIQDLVRKALADELLFGKLVNGGKVTVDVKGEEGVRLQFADEEVIPSSVANEMPSLIH